MAGTERAEVCRNFGLRPVCACRESDWTRLGWFAYVHACMTLRYEGGTYSVSELRCLPPESRTAHATHGSDSGTMLTTLVIARAWTLVCHVAYFRWYTASQRPCNIELGNSRCSPNDTASLPAPAAPLRRPSSRKAQTVFENANHKRRRRRSEASQGRVEKLKTTLEL